jgi:hypothetical protein
MNDGNISFTLSGPTTIYLLRRNDWIPVIPIENYTLDNDSAMYVFVSASGGVVTRV